MVTVMAFGTFDGFHKGHEHYLTQAKKFGDWLVVVVSRDETVKDMKGRLPKHNQDERLKHIASLDYVDEAILGMEEDFFEVIIDVVPDVICLGYDQWIKVDVLEHELKDRGLSDVKIVRLDSYMPEKYKSSKMS